MHANIIIHDHCRGRKDIYVIFVPDEEHTKKLYADITVSLKYASTGMKALTFLTLVPAIHSNIVRLYLHPVLPLLYPRPSP